MNIRHPHIPTLLVFDMHGAFILFTEDRGEFTIRTKTLITDVTVTIPTFELMVDMLADVLSKLELISDDVLSSFTGEPKTLYRTGAMRLKPIYHIKALVHPELKLLLPVIGEL